MKKYIVGLGVVLFAPAVASAQNALPDSTALNALLGIVKTTLNYIIPILITLAVIYFIWGVISFAISKDEEERKKARDQIVYGIIGLFVIVAIWGLVGFLSNLTGVGTGGGGTEGGLPCVDQNPLTPICD